MDHHKKTESYLAQKEKTPQDFGFADHDQALKQNRNAIAAHHRMMKLLELPGKDKGVALKIIDTKGLSAFRVNCRQGGVTYKLRARVGLYENAPLKSSYLRFNYVRGKNSIPLEVVKVRGTLEQPELIEVEVSVPPGKLGSFTFKKRAEKEDLAPAIWMDYVEVEGPFYNDRKVEEVLGFFQVGCLKISAPN